IEDRRAAVRVAHLGDALRDLGDRGVPVDRLVRAVGAPAHRAREPVARVLVVVEPQTLLARVALRPRVRLVAADARDATPLGAHLDPAVDAAEDAGARTPVGGRRPVAHRALPRSGFNERTLSGPRRLRHHEALDGALAGLALVEGDGDGAAPEVD